MSISDLENSLTALNGAVNNLDVTGLINNVQTALNNETNRAEGSENNLNNSIQTLTNSLNNVTSQIQQLSSSGGGGASSVAGFPIAGFNGFSPNKNIVVQAFTATTMPTNAFVWFPVAFNPKCNPIVVTMGANSSNNTAYGVQAFCLNGNGVVVQNYGFYFLKILFDSNQAYVTQNVSAMHVIAIGWM